MTNKSITLEYKGVTEDQLEYVALSYDETKEFMDLGNVLLDIIADGRQSPRQASSAIITQEASIRQASDNLVSFILAKSPSGSLSTIRFMLDTDYIRGILDEVTFPVAKEILRHKTNDDIQVYLKMKWHL